MEHCKSNSISYFFYSILIYSIIIQDIPFFIQYGDFTRYLSNFIIPMVFIFSLILCKKYYSKYFYYYSFLLIYVLIFSLLKIVLLSFQNESLNYIGEYIPFKVIKLFLPLFFSQCFIILLISLTRNLNIDNIFKPISNAYFFMFIIMLIEYRLLPNGFSFLHVYNPYGRIRLLSQESSFTSTLVVAFGLLSLYYYSSIKNNKLYTKAMYITLALFVLLSGSKSFLVTVLIALTIQLLLSKNNKKKFLLFFLIILSAAILGKRFLRLITSDIEQYTSVATRSTLLISAFLISIKSPFGVSLASYESSLLQQIDLTIDSLKIIKKLNSDELLRLLTQGSSKGIGAKAGFLDFGIYWGIVGNFVFFLFLYQTYKKICRYANNSILLLSFICTVFLCLTTIPINNKYEIWLVFCIPYLINKKVPNHSWRLNENNLNNYS